jgi:hypothetical protein
MQITIDRTETTTGGPARTKREEIIPVFSEDDEVEPDIAFDCSESEGWTLDSGLVVWPVQMEAVRQFIVGAAELDSQAAAEQASGDEEKGGVYAAGFNHELIKVGAGPKYDLRFVEGRPEDDNGDLNPANFAEKIDALHTRHKASVPSGGTKIMSTVKYLDAHYLGEFGDRPVSERPKRARSVWTDGAMSDYQEFGRRLVEDHSGEWPAEEWFIAILGEGDAHNVTLNLYQGLAKSHSNLHVYSFDQVSNPAEIAEDMAVAMLAQTPAA